ncbi:MAG: hypothetical protein E7377_00250 [Clostridiales bacterium]|nr:hypothetical protein [Clostridiales bacterium]
MHNEKATISAWERGGQIARYILLTGVLSFIGWAYETTFMFVMTGRFDNRGFLTLPFCPIYGCSLLLVYLLLGTPTEGRGILKNVENPFRRYSLYLVFAFLIPTAAELLVGFVFERFFDTWLWSYAGFPFNFRGYISLPISLAWMGLIFLFMRFLFSPIKNAVFRIASKTAVILAVFLVAAVAVDLTFSFLSI